MRILVLDSALSRSAAALVIGGEVTALRTEERRQGHEAVLPAMARDVMAGSGAVDLVAAIVGPGSFTGIRAGLALAHGIGLGLGVPVIGVTVGEAIASAFPRLGTRALWVATGSRRGHIFLEHGETIESLAIDALPRPSGPVAIAGPEARDIAARLAARGFDVLLTDCRYAPPRHVALTAARRHLGEISPRPPQPLYVDPPEARLPAGGLRPFPEPASRG